MRLEILRPGPCHAKFSVKKQRRRGGRQGEKAGNLAPPKLSPFWTCEHVTWEEISGHKDAKDTTGGKTKYVPDMPAQRCARA